MLRLHVIVHLSLDGRIFIVKRKHTEVKYVARLLPKDHKLGNILELHLPNAMSVGKPLRWVQVLGLEQSDHENVQFLTMEPSHDESSVYESLGWDTDRDAGYRSQVPSPSDGSFWSCWGFWLTYKKKNAYEISYRTACSETNLSVGVGY